MKAYDKALYHLSRYPKTTAKIREYLLDKDYARDEIEEAITLLITQKVLNDEEYISLYFESEVIRKWKSVMNIRNKLRQKWAERDMIDAYVENNEEVLNSAMKKWISRSITQLIARWTAPREIIRKVTTKGYPYGLVKEVYELMEEE